MIKDTEKTKVHKVVSVSVFTGKTVLKKSEAPEWETLEQGRLILGGRGSGKEHLNKLDIH